MKDEGRTHGSAPTILIFTPTWIDPVTGEDAIAPECEAAIKSQVLRDGEFDWHVTTENPYPLGDLRNVLHQYVKAREYFLHGRWDALLTVEHDNVLPDPGAVQRMVETLQGEALRAETLRATSVQADVVYAPYKLRHGNPVLNVLQYINDTNLGESLSGHKHELERARREIVHRVSGTGMGCTLFSRMAIEKVPFTETGRRCASPDMSFSKAALKHRLLMVGRFDVPVLHLSEGRWLHPFKREEVKMHYRALQTVNIMVDGDALKLTAGEIVELSPALAHDWLRAGYIAPLEKSPTDGSPAKPLEDEFVGKAVVEAAVVEPAETADAPAQAKRKKKQLSIGK